MILRLCSRQVRVRFSEEEIQKLIKMETLVCIYPLPANRSLHWKITCSEQLTVTEEDDFKFVLGIPTQVLNKMFLNSDQTLSFIDLSGNNVEICLEVDLFKPERRKKHESQKNRHSVV